MIVCVCRRVSDREIARLAHTGAGFDDIQFELGVATQCGCCEDVARGLVAQCHISGPVAHIRPDDALPAVQPATLSAMESTAWHSSHPQLAV